MEILTSFLLIILGFFVGVPMGLSYPFEPDFKALYIFLVVSSIIGFITGIIIYKKTYGKYLLICSLLLWAILGMIGLGTGT